MDCNIKNTWFYKFITGLIYKSQSSIVKTNVQTSKPKNNPHVNAQIVLDDFADISSLDQV